jgi:hypothetical protein
VITLISIFFLSVSIYDLEQVVQLYHFFYPFLLRCLIFGTGTGTDHQPGLTPDPNTYVYLTLRFFIFLYKVKNRFKIAQLYACVIYSTGLLKKDVCLSSRRFSPSVKRCFGATTTLVGLMD